MLHVKAQFSVQFFVRTHRSEVYLYYLWFETILVSETPTQAE